MEGGIGGGEGSKVEQLHNRGVAIVVTRAWLALCLTRGADGCEQHDQLLQGDSRDELGQVILIFTVH